MDLIRWSLSAIDKIFSTRSAGLGDPACPDGTFTAGYVRDSWSEWRPMCLAVLSVEDIEAIWIFGLLATSLLLMGLGIGLVYRQNEVRAAINKAQKLPEKIAEVSRAVNGQNTEC